MNETNYFFKEDFPEKETNDSNKKLPTPTTNKKEKEEVPETEIYY